MLPWGAFSARYSMALVEFQGQLLLLGGMDPYQHLADVWVSADGMQWVQDTHMPGALSGCSAVLLGSVLFTIGGWDPNEVTVGYALAEGAIPPC